MYSPVSKHTQQSRLRSHRQLTHLVEEDGAFVGHAKVAVGLTDSTRKRAFLMSEKLAVDGTLRDRPTVDGKVFLAAAR
jgi:hypothetical protein